MGLNPASKPEEAKFHFINTCTFIKEATEETIQTILQAGEIKKEGLQRLIVVGCFAERYGHDIESDLNEVDLYFGTGKYDRAGEILKESFPYDFQDIPAWEGSILERWSSNTPENLTKPYSYIKISDGCNRGCGFCIIPSLRGKFRDTDRNQIINQAKLSAELGAKELCIVSQDTISYKKDPLALRDLLIELSQIESVEIIRPLYLYPDKNTMSLLKEFPKIPKIAPYLESPLQHVSPKVLKNMNRSGDPEFFKELYQIARDSIPGMEIRTSFVIGYPGETEEDIEMLLKFLEETRPEKVNLFPYSPQEGTKGFNFPGKPKHSVTVERVNRIREFYLEYLKEIHESRIGKVFKAILDSREGGQMVARRLQDAPEMDEVVYLEDTPSLKIGTIGHLRVESFMEYDMSGTWVDSIGR